MTWPALTAPSDQYPLQQITALEVRQRDSAFSANICREIEPGEHDSNDQNGAGHEFVALALIKPPSFDNRAMVGIGPANQRSHRIEEGEAKVGQLVFNTR